jgi:hypothetical protein
VVLVLAANTAFADFPRLSYFLARDGFLPHLFSIAATRWPRPALSCWPWPLARCWPS